MKTLILLTLVLIFFMVKWVSEALHHKAIDEEDDFIERYNRERIERHKQRMAGEQD